MSTADVFTSSPLKAARMDSFPIPSSSPDFPSVTEMFTQEAKGQSTGSRRNAATIPANPLPIQTFTSAANPLRDAPERNITTEPTRSPTLKPKTVNGLMRRVAANEQTSAEKEGPILIDSSPKEGSGQGFKSRTPTPEAKRPAILTGGVTKSLSVDTGKRKANQTRTKSETVSKHFAPKKGNQPAGKGKQVEKRVAGDALAIVQGNANPTSCSEPALRRRDDWTPPPADDAIVIGSDSDHRELLSSIDRTRVTEDIFPRLFDTYAHKEGPGSTSSGLQQQAEAECLKKRKRTELVSGIGEQYKHVAQAAETSPLKAAPTKKKTRTITELAMAPYAAPEPEFNISERGTRDSLLEYFDAEGEVKALVEHQSLVMSKNKETMKPTKAKAKPRKKKAGGVEAPILLSPNSALKESSNQDFVFGTSSQLVGDESPTTLRQLQLAIQASNRDDDPFDESGSQGLWRAGARDQDGDLMEVEVVDLVRTPTLPDKHRGPSVPPSENPPLPDLLPSDDFIDIDTISLDTPVAQKSAAGQPNSSTHQVPTPPLSAPNNPATTSLPSAPRPKYETFTDNQLSKQLTSYGFKPVKKRQAMIALLDQCWASKNPGSASVSAQSISTTAAQASPKGKKKATAIPQPPAPEDPVEKPVKRPRGRPKKTDAAVVASEPAPAAAKPEKKKSPKKTRGKSKSPTRKPSTRKSPTRKGKVIADSEESDLENDRVLSPSRSSSRSRSRSPSLADLSTVVGATAAGEEAEDMSLFPTPTTTDDDDARGQAGLFRCITRAVTAEPRSRDPARPSWHEKMLMYDPVVLEDLAAWLNAGPLTRAGFDGEVAPTDVKRWCEMRSIICVWRLTTRKRERKR